MIKLWPLILFISKISIVNPILLLFSSRSNNKHLILILVQVYVYDILESDSVSLSLVFTLGYVWLVAKLCKMQKNFATYQLQLFGAIAKSLGFTTSFQFCNPCVARVANLVSMFPGF